ncbi:P-loop NTPase fold protein [Weissella confusa]|uniref:P-loop NTPase fold protein n=1 Tax=Weissella confusa TaxID=1583 RepID=UPI0022E5156B|nr:P-loop NTPase fold protein [Weissella confusa]
MDNLKDIIRRYVSNSDTLALEIDGEWGIGKTYSVKKIFENFGDAWPDGIKRKHVYISVSGMQGVDIERQFYESIIANMPADMTGIPAKLLTGISKTANDFNVSLNGVSLDIPIGLLIKKLESMIQKNYVYVIDDLERISDEKAMAQLFGFISSVLQETYQSKVIVLMNENALNESNYSFFQKNREKVFNRVIRFKTDKIKVIKELTTDSLLKSEMDSKNILEIVEESIASVTAPEEPLNLRTFKVFLSYLADIRKELQGLNTVEIPEDFWKELVPVLFEIVQIFRQGVDKEVSIIKQLSLSTMGSFNKSNLVHYVISGNHIDWLAFLNNFKMQQELFNTMPSMSTIINFRQHTEIEVKNAQERLVRLQDIRFETVQQAMGILSAIAFMKSQDLWFLSDEEYDSLKKNIYEYLSATNFDEFANYMNLPLPQKWAMFPETVVQAIESIVEVVQLSDSTIDTILETIESGVLTINSSFETLKNMKLDQVILNALLAKLKSGEKSPPKF